MKQRSVGTFTLGLFLLASGIIYLISGVFKLSIGIELIKLWPLILISLGIEVIYYNYVSEKQNCPIKFSGISIFLIIVFLFISLGAYTFSSVCSELLDPTSPVYYRNYIK